MRIALSGGGTGGHLIIAKNLATVLQMRGIPAIFIGSTHGQDRAWFEQSELFERKFFLPSSGVVNKRGLSKISSLLNILKLAQKTRKILKDEKIDAVISVGGYSSAPASFAAVSAKLPFFIHEQNALIGRLNRLLKPFAKGFYSSYFEPKFPYPINELFFRHARERAEMRTIIFLGGSQGAHFINSLACKLAVPLTKLGYKIIHQCGEKEYEKMREFYSQNAIDVELVGFCTELDKLACKADLCIGRSGASTLWELVANGLPAIFVPFPYAAGDHQYYNAKFLADQNLCEIVRQEDANADKILDKIRNFDVVGVSKKLLQIDSKDGAKSIIDDILSKI